MSRLALITFLSGGNDVDPGYGVNAGGRPDNSLPGLPPGAVTLPVFPFDPTVPDQGLPSTGTPDNTLPSTRPTRPGNELPSPGRKYVVKWLACHGLVLVPDNTLPETPEPK